MRCVDDPVMADIVGVLRSAETIAKIQECLLPRYTLEEINSGLSRLTSERLITPASRSHPATAAYWDSAGCNPPRGEIGFRPICRTSEALLRHALEANDLAVSDRAECLLVTTDDYLRPELAQINARSQPWLIAKPCGHTIWIGPLFVPGRTCCWACLARWLRPHRWAQAAFYGWGDTDFPPQISSACLPTTLGFAAGMIATVVALWLAKGGFPELEDTVLSFDTRTLSSSRNVLRTRPDCPHCRGGSVRCPLPSNHLREFISPITSIVSGLEITDRPVGGVFHAHATFVAPLPDSPCRPLLKLQHAGGKGMTPEVAETACIAEALERYSLIYQGPEQRTRARISEVEARDPGSVLLFSDSQYNNRTAWNQTHSELHWVPQRLDSSVEIDWSGAKSLVSGRTEYFPTSLCYMYYPSPPNEEFCVADTNGCAAGASLTEAILGALLELVERDAVAIWWYNRLCRPAMDLESLGDAGLLEFDRSFREIGRQLHLLDVTTDLRIPSFVAVAAKLDGSQPCFGAGAGMSARKAAFQAAAEVAQIVFWSENGSGSEEMRSWIQSATLDEQAYLKPCGVVSAYDEHAMDPGEGLASCVRLLWDAGHEPFYLDLTRPEVGLPVVRAIVPGLRHFWARLGPGRLYDVPVRMGWSNARLSESEMNPIPCMI